MDELDALMEGFKDFRFSPMTEEEKQSLAEESKRIYGDLESLDDSLLNPIEKLRRANRKQALS